MSNLGKRVILAIIGALMLLLLVFKGTPELDSVKNALLYRVSFFMLMMRGYIDFLFEWLGLFPLE